jgi:hypothetical protein
MTRILQALAAVAAAGALAYAGPARACGDQQKTTTSKAEEQKAQPQQQTAAVKPAGKDAQAQQQNQAAQPKTAGAQAKADKSTAAVQTEQR